MNEIAVRRATRVPGGDVGQALRPRVVEPDLLAGDPSPRPGEDAWLRSAYRAHGGEMYGFAVRSLRDRGLAEEAVQETFVRAWRAAEKFDSRVASLRTWLFSILRHVVVDLWRARAARPPLAGGDPRDATAEDQIDQALASWQVEEAMRGIGEDH